MSIAVTICTALRSIVNEVVNISRDPGAEVDTNVRYMYLVYKTVRYNRYLIKTIITKERAQEAIRLVAASEN
jgi:hypothetical protein